jgi:hypothetical protein
MFLGLVCFMLLSHITINKYLRGHSIFLRLLGYSMPLIVVVNMLMMIFNIIAFEYILYIAVPLIIHFTYLSIIDWITKKRKKQEAMSYGPYHIRNLE